LFIATAALLSGTAVAKDKIKEGTHRMVMVVNVPPLDEILKSVDRVKLAASGVDEATLRDGSIAVGTVYCCNQKIARDEKIVFYVPKDMSVEFADMVEVRIGRPRKSKKDDAGLYSRAVSIRGNLEKETGECSWNTEDTRMWMNILICDWMEEEGWTYQGGLNKSWYKPAQATQPQ
jgi:hypothetical protein